MSPLLFVVLLGLLAGLVLFLLVIGIGALLNLLLNRVPTKASKVSATDESEVTLEEESGSFSAPEPEMQLAAAVPVSAVERVEVQDTSFPQQRGKRDFPKYAVQKIELSQPEPEPEAPQPTGIELQEAESEDVAAVGAKDVESEPAVAAVAAESRPRRKFPRPASKPVQQAPEAPEQAAELTGAPDDVELAEVSQPEVEAADPFAAVMAALNKR